MKLQMQRMPMEQLLPVLKLQMEQGGSAWLTVTGSSMHPTFRHGKDRVELVQRQPRKGDVVLYQRGDGAYILHRIVGNEGTDWLCAGDNQWQTERVAPEQVLACVQSFQRGEKQCGVEAFGYKSWTGAWTLLLPLRKPILKLRRSCGRIIHKWRKQK